MTSATALEARMRHGPDAESSHLTRKPEMPSIDYLGSASLSFTESVPLGGLDATGLEVGQ